MSQAASRPALLKLEEYLELEEASDVRHEYVAGMIYALAGATKRHDRIAGSIYARLWLAARAGPCRVYSNDVKMRAAADLLYYPDVTVTCVEDPGHPLIEESPCLLVEVTSPSTERIDRREKLLASQQIPTLQAYLIVSHDRRRVSRHWRDLEGSWRHAEVAGSGMVPIPCPTIELSLEEIYEGVEVPA